MSGISPQSSKSRTLLAVDLGTTVGYAIWQDGVVTSGSFDLSKSSHRRFEGPGMRFIRFTRLLKEFPKPDLVAFEEVRRHLGVDAAHAYGGYMSHLTSFCDGSDPQIPYEGIPVGTIKKRATGAGNASKDEMVAACKDRLRYEPANDNEADARWILVLMTEAESLPWPGGPVSEPPSKTKDKKMSKSKNKKINKV